MKIIKNIKNIIWKKETWKDIEYFNEEWKNRIKLMSTYIEKNSTIIDLGCGEMWTKEFLPLGCNYYAVDYKKRSNDTIICDFNNYQFPNLNVDISFVSGCLEYIDDYLWFIKQITCFSNKCILSYCTIENFPDINDRKKKTWVNNLSRNEIVNIFKSAGFSLINEDVTISKNVIFVFKKNI